MSTITWSMVWQVVVPGTQTVTLTNGTLIEPPPPLGPLSTLMTAVLLTTAGAVTVSAVLGKATMQVSQLLKLGRGAVVELDRKLGEAIDIYVNNRLVARGEVVMVDDNRLGVTMTEIVKADRPS